MAALYNTEIVTYEEIQIYSFVISFFCIFFHEKLNNGPILTLSLHNSKWPPFGEEEQFQK